MGETQPVGAPGGGQGNIGAGTQKGSPNLLHLYYTCATATLIVQEEEVLRVFPGMNAELRQSP